MHLTFECTFHGFGKWLHHLTEKCVYMMMKKVNNNNPHAVMAYATSIDNLIMELEERLKLESDYEKTDLNIMLKKAKFLKIMWQHCNTMDYNNLVLEGGAKKKRTAKKGSKKSVSKAW